MIATGRWLCGTLVVTVIVLGVVRPLVGWGFWSHKEINRFAIQALPEDMRGFFTAHGDSIVEKSIVPDLRRRTDDQEQYYHYIDIDRYGRYPFSKLPRDLEKAQTKYGSDSLRTNGIVPWRIVELLEKLTKAMNEKKTVDIIDYAADLGHYVADIHVPLHTTENYDGQLSGQPGVHGRFESELPARYGIDYNLEGMGADYIDDPLGYTFDLILESYLLVDSVLNADKIAKQGIPEEQLYRIVKRNGRKEYHYSSLYYERFNFSLDGMPERRMRAAVRRLASFWYTAWVKAGEPQLPDD